MAEAVVIVESPAKARTLGRYLGKKYEVKASMGHVADLPGKELGIDVEKNFKPKYETLPDRKKTLTELRKATKAAKQVFLAPDPDREGEAIAFHLKERLKLPADKVFRVTFNEITKQAVLQAFDHPSRIDMDRVNAQQARRILDRLVGYKLSPLLWKKVTKGLSAGRVQSVAVRLIVEREKEIRAFKAEEYWKAAVDLATQGAGEDDFFTAELRKIEGKPARIHNEEEARKIEQDLKDADYVVRDLIERERSVSAKPPFNTSTLQQQASIKLRFRAKRTMMIAQQLYEGIELGDEGPTGLITYMRTDTYRVSDEALKACRDHIRDEIGEKWLSPKPNVFKVPKGAQAAHEAVRPTDVTRTPDSIKSFLSRDQLRLYRLIWERFVASQMAPARFAVTEISVDGGPYFLQCRGTRRIFDGFQKVWKDDRSGDKDDKDLPRVAKGDALDNRKVALSQHFTQPPPRFTEATLVKTLEKLGIGRPSTYAPILSTIQARGYVKLTERKFMATEIGEIVTDLLVDHFPKILEVDFTSWMEDELDRIEDAKADWVKVLRDFYGLFEKDLERALKEMPDLKKNPKPSDKTCEKCGARMVFRLNKHGRFLGCEKFPECRSTISLNERGEAVKPVETEHVCEKCGKPMLLRTGRRGPFLGCSGFPACRNTLSVDDEGNPLKPDKDVGECEKCGSAMVVRKGRRGPFLACSAYPKCRNTMPLKGAGKKAKKSQEKGDEAAEE